MATDAFTGTNGTTPPSASWTNLDNGMQIQSNRCVGTVDVAVNIAYYSGAAFGNDQYSEATLYHGGAGGRSLLCVRVNGSGDLYYADINVDASTTTIWKRVSGSYTQLGANLGQAFGGLVYKLEVIGTSIKLYEGGVQFGATQTDSDITTGKPGLGATTTAEGWDDWTGADTGGGGGGGGATTAKIIFEHA